MPGALTVSRFNGSFATLNGGGKITATHADITRSLMTVGYVNRRDATIRVGRWRLRMLQAMANGYLDSALRTTRYFRNLEQSEKVGVSFLFGEAFTHWFAQDRMKLTHLLHVQGLRSYGITTSTSTGSPKLGSLTPTNKSRPDFIGFNGQDTHVFESKGRQRNPSQNLISKALGQVSTVNRVNGRQPLTRSATFFMLKAAGVEGRVVDPPRAPDAFNISFDALEAKTSAYTFFLETGVEISPLADGFVGVEVVPGIYYAIDKLVLETIKEPPTSESERAARDRELTSILEQRGPSYANIRTQALSVGPDGLLLLDETTRKSVRRRSRAPRG